MAAKLMSTAEALRFIAACSDRGEAISTVDGFHVVPEGYMEDLDLMFSPSASCTAAEAATASQRFIRENDGPDVVWEVWSNTESPPT